jgi:hypothetical protein
MVVLAFSTIASFDGAEKYVAMLFQASVARPATVAFVSRTSCTVDFMPLVTFRLYSVLEFLCLIPVKWMDLGLAYFRQVGANQLLRTFRAAFNPHFFVSGELILNCFLPGLFFLNCFLFSLLFLYCFLSSLFFLDCFLSGMFFLDCFLSSLFIFNRFLPGLFFLNSF